MFSPEKMTYSALVLFAKAVDKVMEAEDLCARERIDLIGHWAYQPHKAEELDAAIARCQAAEFVHPTATSMIDWVTGEVVSFSPSEDPGTLEAHSVID